MIIHFINRSHKILPPIRCLPLRQNSLFIGNHSYSTGIKRRQFNKCSHSAVHSDSFLPSTAVYQRSEQPNILNRLGKCFDFNYYSQVEKRVTGNACTFCRKTKRNRTIRDTQLGSHCSGATFRSSSVVL